MCLHEGMSVHEFMPIEIQIHARMIYLHTPSHMSSCWQLTNGASTRKSQTCRPFASAATRLQKCVRWASKDYARAGTETREKLARGVADDDGERHGPDHENVKGDDVDDGMADADKVSKPHDMVGEQGDAIDDGGDELQLWQLLDESVVEKEDGGGEEQTPERYAIKQQETSVQRGNDYGQSQRQLLQVVWLLLRVFAEGQESQGCNRDMCE